MTFYTDGREDYDVPPIDLPPGTESAGMGYGDNGSASEDTAPDIQIIKGRTLEEVKRNQPQDVIRGGLGVRRNTTAISSMGGTGKTILTKQMLIEAHLKLPLLGVDDFQPVKSVRSLYVNAEDSLANLDYILGRLLPAYELDTVPFDLFVIAASAGRRFMLTPLDVAVLAERINAEGYDLVAFDPAISFLPAGINFIDPAAIRRFLQDSLGVLQTETTAALWLNHHDNKVGDPLSGPADWGNFCRLALHLVRGTSDDTVTLSTVKSNLGYRFKKITLQRDPHTLKATAVDLERYGDRSKEPSSAEDIAHALAKIVRTEIMALPSEQRTKWAVIETLYRKAREAQLKITKESIKGFANTHLRYEERQLGRTKAMIVVGVIEEDIR